MTKIWIYTLCVMVFGFFSYSIQDRLGDLAFLSCGVVYALFARLVAERYGK
jgi:hypothetical protein